jgi:hypothetical protein
LSPAAQCGFDQGKSIDTQFALALGFVFPIARQISVFSHFLKIGLTIYERIGLRYWFSATPEAGAPKT